MTKPLQPPPTKDPFRLTRLLFGSDHELEAASSLLLGSIGLPAVLARHRAGLDPKLSATQSVVLFYEGQSPLAAIISPHV